jgi:hypothetical protein
LQAPEGDERRLINAYYTLLAMRLNTAVNEPPKDAKRRDRFSK